MLAAATLTPAFPLLLASLVSVVAHFIAWRGARTTNGYRKDGFGVLWFTGLVFSIYWCVLNVLRAVGVLDTGMYMSFTYFLNPFAVLFLWAGPPAVWYVRHILPKKEKERR